jgi:hypothetical protein
MSEVINYAFNHKEITELLIKKQDIHEGFWAIYIEFGLGAVNIAAGPDDPNILPAAIVPVKRIGIQRNDQPNPLTVDASQVNPIKKKAK